MGFPVAPATSEVSPLEVETATPYLLQQIAEVIVVAEVNSISVCLMDIGSGIPFISSLEMRQMKSSLYPAAKANQSIA